MNSVGFPRTLSNSSCNLKLISVALIGKGVDFSKHISMIDEMVTLLLAVWGEDDGKKAYGTESLADGGRG